MRERKKIRITGTFTIECGEEEAERFDLDIAGPADSFDWHATQWEDVPYVMPAGTEHWEVGARGTRFAEGESLALVPEDDPGHWWWSNAHAALRCAGTPPAETSCRRIPGERSIAETGQTALARKPAEWRAARTSAGYTVRVAVGVANYSIQEDYAALVEASGPVTWLVPNELAPAHAIDASGQLVALVMPMRVDPDDLLPERAESKAS